MAPEERSLVRLFYAVLFVPGPVVAFVVGVRLFEHNECSGPDFGGECDLAPLAGMGLAFDYLVGAVVLAIVVEVVRRRRR